MEIKKNFIDVIYGASAEIQKNCRKNGEELLSYFESYDLVAGSFNDLYRLENESAELEVLASNEFYAEKDFEVERKKKSDCFTIKKGDRITNRLLIPSMGEENLEKFTKMVLEEKGKGRLKESSDILFESVSNDIKAALEDLYEYICEEILPEYACESLSDLNTLHREELISIIRGVLIGIRSVKAPKNMARIMDDALNFVRSRFVGEAREAFDFAVCRAMEHGCPTSIDFPDLAEAVEDELTRYGDDHGLPYEWWKDEAEIDEILEMI